MENLDPPPPPPIKSRMRKWRVFALRAASSFIWRGWRFAVPFYSVQDCRFVLEIRVKLKKGLQICLIH